MFSILRDYMEGTEFDLTKGKGAGFYGSPVRYAGGPSKANYVKGGWER